MKDFVSSLRARVVPTPGYHGWTVVLAGVLCSALSSPAQTFILSLYVDPIITDTGVGRVALASVYGGATLVAALCLPFVGRLADRVPARRFLGGVIALLGLALAGLSLAQGVVTLALGLFAVRLLGQGAIGLGTLTTTARWFRTYRGRALAMVALGYSAGEVTYPALTLWLVHSLGWRGSLLLLAAVYVLVLAPIVARLVSDREPARDALDGVPRSPAAKGVAESTGPAPVELSFDVRQALRERTFWVALACVAVMPMALTGLIFHQVALFVSAGWHATLVPVAFFGTALCGVIAGYGSGVALERVSVRRVLALSTSVAIVAVAWAVLGPPGVAGAVTYGALLGLANGMSGAANAVLWPNYFGVESLGRIKGIVTGVRNGATAVGPPLVASLLGTEGSSLLRMAAVIGGCLALATAGALTLRAPARPGESGLSGNDALPPDDLGMTRAA